MKKEYIAKDCPVFSKCGGCEFSHRQYEGTLQKKTAWVEELLQHKLEGCEGMEDPFYYRNKVYAAFSYERGNILMGNYEANSKRIVDIDHCLIEDQKAQEINQTVKGLARSFKWSVYSPQSGRGLLKGSLVRAGKRSGEYLLTLVVTSPTIPSAKNFARAIVKEHPEIKSVVYNINEQDSSLILGEREQVSYGPGFIYDRLFDLDFRISSQSFYQVNPPMAEKLYQKAIEFLGLKGREILIDAYCGIGTISLYAARFVKQVYAVEYSKEAIRDAIFNAKRNTIKNVYFSAMDAGEYLLGAYEDQVAARKSRESYVKADAMIINPPRSGLDDKVKEAILKLEVPKIAYISCNPEALAEDLAVLKKKYKLERAHAFDMFPWTGHVETLALLSKLDVDKRP